MSITARLITIVRTVAVSGLIGAAGLGLAGTASAAVAFDNTGGMVATPDTYAGPAAEIVPWASWIQTPGVVVPHVENTVVKSR